MVLSCAAHDTWLQSGPERAAISLFLWGNVNFLVLDNEKQIRWFIPVKTVNCIHFIWLKRFSIKISESEKWRNPAASRGNFLKPEKITGSWPAAGRELWHSSDFGILMGSSHIQISFMQLTVIFPSKLRNLKIAKILQPQREFSVVKLCKLVAGLAQVLGQRSATDF